VGPSSVSLSGIALAAQVIGALIVPLALLFAPPATGAMLLISTGGTNAVRFARDHGGAILGNGPFAGSIVVFGDRSRLVRNPFSSGIIALAASPAGCGTLRVPAR
jgi:hypothetical protein